MIILKVTKNQGFTLSSEDTFLEKNTGVWEGGGKLPPPSHFRVKSRYPNNLESLKGSVFVFNYVHLLYYKCHKINLNCNGSYTDFPAWIKNNKAAINLINTKDNKCFQYAATVA